MNETCVLDLRDGDDVEWPALLAELSPYLDRCVFVVVPGKFGDSEASLRLWRRLAPPTLECGYPLAFAAQFDAAADDGVPVYSADLNCRVIYLE